MTKMEALLRISVARAELLELADALDPHTRATLTYAARIVALVKPATLEVATPALDSPIPKIG